MTTNQPQPGSDLDAAIAEMLGKPTLSKRIGFEDRVGMQLSVSLPYSIDTATAMATLEQLRKEKEWYWAIYSPGAAYTLAGDKSDKFHVEVREVYEGKSDISLAHAAALAILAALEAEK